MKKIINGKKYDTETARELASYSNGGGWRDFQHFEETLHQKRTGEYFLYGEGGPASRYAETCGLNGRCGGEKIIPLTEIEAQEWAEEHLDGEDYEEIFGEVAEDDISGQIVELIKRSGLTQREFASKYHIPLRTVESWCAGKRTPPEYVAYLLQLAEAR